MNRTKRLLAIYSLISLVFFTACSKSSDKPITLKSPGERATLTLALIDNQPHWSVNYGDTGILNLSKLGLSLEEPYQGGFRVLHIDRYSNDETWKPVWGKFSNIRNHYNEVTWQLEEIGPIKRRIDIIARAYDAGVAIRYRIHGDNAEKAMINKDITHFSFTGDFTCWSANGENPNIGPVKLSEYNGSKFPLTVQITENCYCSVLEAAINNYSPIKPERISETEFCSSFESNNVTLPSETSWRVLLLGKSPGDLLTGSVLVNLNQPNKIENPSWINPGLAMWDWRAWGGTATDGFKYNLDMASWRRFIDFASENNISYLVLDANWYGHERDPKSNPMKSRDYLVYQPDPASGKMADKPAPENWEDPIDIPLLIKYGKERNVGVFLYINDVARHHYDFEKTLETYHKWGAAGIKYGFMKGKGQQKVLDTRSIVELCAKYELACDFHDSPVPPSGDRRTYPNYLAREFCHAQSDNLKSFTPETFCTTVFCNMLAGPLDMCNGFFTLIDIEKVRPKVFQAVNSTVVAEAARVMIVFSGLAYLPDTPDSYQEKADLFDFISKLPMTWDETKILNSKIGGYITTARRSGNEWFIASCCNKDGAELPITFDFLKEGTTYEATLYEDAPTTHYIHNKEEYIVRKINVTKDEAIKAKLAPGGGHCIYLVPVK